MEQKILVRSIEHQKWDHTERKKITSHFFMLAQHRSHSFFHIRNKKIHGTSSYEAGRESGMNFWRGESVSSTSVQQCEEEDFWTHKKTRYRADTAGEDGSCCDSFKQEIKRGIIKWMKSNVSSKKGRIGCTLCGCTVTSGIICLTSVLNIWLVRSFLSICWSFLL